MNKMKIKKLSICSVIVGAVFILLDMIFSMATIPLYAKYAELPIWNNPPNIIAGMVFDIINGFILVCVYNLLYDGIPGDRVRKGAVYGFIVGLFRVIMMTFSVIVVYNVPFDYVIMTMITGYVEIIVLGIILALIYEKMNIKDL